MRLRIFTWIDRVPFNGKILISMVISIKIVSSFTNAFLVQNHGITLMFETVPKIQENKPTLIIFKNYAVSVDLQIKNRVR